MLQLHINYLLCEASKCGIISWSIVFIQIIMASGIAHPMEISREDYQDNIFGSSAEETGNEDSDTDVNEVEEERDENY